jgi:hypothetical protein
MLIRRVLIALVGTLLLTPAAFAAPARHGRAGSINARQHRQSARIHQGVKSGEITKGEADKLRADRAGVRAEERVYRKPGDGLNKREKRDLQRDLNKTNREIRRAKHNNREAGGR